MKKPFFTNTALDLKQSSVGEADTSFPFRQKAWKPTSTFSLLQTMHTSLSFKKNIFFKKDFRFLKAIHAKVLSISTPGCLIIKFLKPQVDLQPRETVKPQLGRGCKSRGGTAQPAFPLI
uniref:Uncharacterized protein n=1 Tax=Anguilla anguilla TaxID=7936 RepID=A0A0E9WRL9_ANGAN